MGGYSVSANLHSETLSQITNDHVLSGETLMSNATIADKETWLALK